MLPVQPSPSPDAAWFYLGAYHTPLVRDVTLVDVAMTAWLSGKISSEACGLCLLAAYHDGHRSSRSIQDYVGKVHLRISRIGLAVDADLVEWAVRFVEAECRPSILDGSVDASRIITHLMQHHMQFGDIMRVLAVVEAPDCIRHFLVLALVQLCHEVSMLLH